ncbi:tyrosine-type recombinase/integrase [Actinobacillus pleuropneumoniae]|uniref:Site-specific integrase n=4 Tax=Actinobacillus pleuropneumoniae TaxID=715 RepID=A0A9Q4DIY9_ACTPL|nr:site-specific integrase [Actinobacillus pleuropneumoniae]EFM91139.1 Integrase [Actinobacillus pleuropneumoniae serovar 6 str. Femo]EFN02012.1 Integrase [Actinobacillus pleuropneumoniae serovar 13 str. N273]MBT9319337.1 site-specific integrase [Actinobacillus pleuropneumoniae]MBT9344232.1 site-specific integrase [Actinobacillus pleuropneumoniae]MCY6368679.1 site-specific integrase [Actinobacillus pleuropneumoniae]
MNFYYKNFLHRYLRADTKKSYDKAIRQVCKQCEIEFPSQVTSDVLLAWRNRVVGTKIKPVTWNSYLRHLKCIYKFGIEHNLLNYQENPCNKLFLRTGKAKRKVLTKSQMMKLDFFLQGRLPAVLSPQWFIQTIINTFRFTAIRRAQLLRLKVDDVDLSRKVIHISPEINKNHEYHCIPISEKLLPYLEMLIAELRKHHQCTNSQLFNINLFRKTRYKWLITTEYQISHLFRVISKNIGFQVSPHRFRHTVATNLMRNPDNLYVAKQLLGHKDVRVTLTYIENDVEMIREKVNKELL